MTINKRIREIRKENNLNQLEFAKKIGSKQTVISFIERDYSTVKEPIIELICKKFGINENWLRTGNGEKYEIDDEYTKAVVEIDKGDLKAREAILTYWKLPEEDKKLFWYFIEKFQKK